MSDSLKSYFNQLEWPKNLGRSQLEILRHAHLTGAFAFFDTMMNLPPKSITQIWRSGYIEQDVIPVIHKLMIGAGKDENLLASAVYGAAHFRMILSGLERGSFENAVAEINAAFPGSISLTETDDLNLRELLGVSAVRPEDDVGPLT